MQGLRADLACSVRAGMGRGETETALWHVHPDTVGCRVPQQGSVSASYCTEKEQEKPHTQPEATPTEWLQCYNIEREEGGEMNPL